jgi:hypothetical protein
VVSQSFRVRERPSRGGPVRSSRPAIPGVRCSLFVQAGAVQIPDQPNGALHTNSRQFCLDTMLMRAVLVMQCSETQKCVGTFDCHGHFSLAKPLHLAIMCGQLGNGWDARSPGKTGNATSHIRVRLEFLVRCHRVMCSSENPPPGAGARRTYLLRRLRAALHIHINSDSLKTCKGSVLSWHFAQG